MYHHVKYNGSANSDIQRNGIYFAVISDQVSLFPAMESNIRIGYRDN